MVFQGFDFRGGVSKSRGGFWRASLLLLSFLVGGTSVFGFGATGHRVVARIAEEHLSVEAKRAVANLLGDESLVEASTWADWIRSDPDMDHTGPWHYINMPDGVRYEESEKSPAGDAYVQLTRSIEVLRDGGSERAAKVDALRWVVHLVADLHQPLHVGRAEDRGGNSIRGEWFGKPTNAHRIWDSDLIDTTDLSFSELAESIDRRVQVKVEAGPEPDIFAWIAESAAYRDRAYAMPESNTKGTYRYLSDNLGLVEERLKQAGLRLALTLEYALGDPGDWVGMPPGLHWVRNSVEYRVLTRQVFQSAGRELEALVASGELKGKVWGVALDADETILDNSLEAKERAGRPFDPKLWDDWCRREEAPAVAGSVAFIQRVKELGGKVAIVSNRGVEVQESTEANLRALGVDFDVVLLMDKDDKKDARWELLRTGKARKGLEAMELVLFFGDNILDFPGMSQEMAGDGSTEVEAAFGKRYFVLPNPVYGSWWRKAKL